MSLYPHVVAPVPEETVRVAHAALPKGHPYLTFRVGHGCLPPRPGLALTWQVVGPGGLRHTLSRYPPRIQRSRVHVRWRGIVSRGRGYGTNAAAGVRRPDPASLVLI